MTHIVAFDGTSAYIIPLDEVDEDIEIIGAFENFEEAERVCDNENEMI